VLGESNAAAPPRKRLVPTISLKEIVAKILLHDKQGLGSFEFTLLALDKFKISRILGDFCQNLGVLIN
jgi:hypothetical protein